MSLNKSSLYVLILLFLLFLTSSISNIWMLRESNNSLDNVNTEVGTILAVTDPINHSRRTRIFLTNSLREGELGNTAKANKALEDARGTLRDADNTFNKYMNGHHLPGENQLLDAYRETYLAYRQKGLQTMVDSVANHDMASYNQEYNEMDGFAGNYLAVVNKILAFHQNYSKQLNDDAHQSFTNGVIYSIFSFLLFGAIIVSILILLRKKVLNPLNNATILAENIANGDLTSNIADDNSRNELGKLQRAMKSMNQQLKSMVSDIRNTVDQVAETSSDIANGNIDLAARTEQQAAAIVETAASMEQLTSTVKRNASNAKEASQMAESATTNAREGGVIVSEVVQTMEGISDSSKRITEITNVINSISFQTNILALNAAVEAARAGEQGRGFAVVAGEVRTLAQRSAQASKEIEALINESTERVDAGTQLVHRAGRTIDEAVKSVTHVSEIIHEIATASDEQSRGVEQIGKAVVELDTTTQQNTALVHETSSTASSLEEQSAHLARLVAVFKVNDKNGYQKNSSKPAVTPSRATDSNGASVASKPTPQSNSQQDDDWATF
jgi:methyl-accepting chemotaxis protein-3 (ribose and galactose sensor receptor)